MEHNKKQMIEEMMTFPDKYANLLHLSTNGQWDKNKLENLGISDLIAYLRDLQIFERNRIRHEQTGN